MKTKILELLKNTPGYVSGQQICETFGVSRTTIWNLINQLRRDGYVIESLNNKGYRIISSPDILSESEILSALSYYQVNFPGRLYYWNELDSTNTRAKQRAEHGAPDWSLVVADRQTSGKGRRGRSFDSPAGVGIFMTLLLRPSFLPDKASMLTLVSGIAVCQAIRELTGLDAQIKWPNDVVIHGKKICGILTEMSSEIQCINYVVIGIGVNVNNPSFPKDIEDVATSLFIESGKTFQRSTLIADILKYFREYYEIFQRTQNLSDLKDLYNSLMINYNRKVYVIQGREKYEAIARTIDDDGELLIERDGVVSKVISGEVSVRGVYGYV